MLLSSATLEAVINKRLMKGRIVMKEHGEYYTCKRLRFLEYLIRNGFTPCATIPDPTNYRYNWWQFKNSAELEECVNRYFENLKNKNN